MTKFSRFWLRTRVFFAVLAQRTIGRAIALGKKNTNIKGRMIPAFFARKFVPRIRGLDTGPVSTATPETIWSFWDGPQVPEIVGACIDSIERHRGPFERKLLDLKTIDDYSDLPGYVRDKLRGGAMSFAHFSDLLRLNLLLNNGGVWMDATDFMTAPIPKHITDADFFVFLTDKKTYFSYSFMQNCFIRAKRGAWLLRAWHDLCLMYWRDEDKKIVDYFAHQLMFKAMIGADPTAQKLFAEMPHETEDQALQFVGPKLFAPFDAAEWARIKNESFFQKVTYKVWNEPSLAKRISGEYWRKRGSTARVADYPGTFFGKIATGEIK